LGNGKDGRRNLWLALGLLAGFLVYAYGFTVTRVNLDQIRDDDRQNRLVNIVRALARPELIEYDLAETTTATEFFMPCPADSPAPPPPEGERTLVVIPACAEPRAEVTVEGTGFLPNQPVRLALIPTSQVELRLADVRTDGSGSFSAVVRLPNRPAEEPQTLLARTTEPAGSPRLTQTFLDTFDKIIETIFLALIATTVATLLAIPLSFFAARNLMKDIQSPLANVALGLIAVPVGAVLGAAIAGLAARLTLDATNNTLMALGGVLVVPPATWWLFRRAMPTAEEDRPTSRQRFNRGLLMLGAFVTGVFALYFLAALAQDFGGWLAPRLGVFDFIGSFLSTLGELLEVGTTVLAALFGAGALATLANRLGHSLRRHLPAPTLRLLNVPLAMLAGMVIALIIARAIAWLYQWTDPGRTLWIPLGVGAALGLALALRSYRRDSVRVGLGTYYVTRTVFNVLRAIEPLIMAIVFVVWVGIGPFAGALALALHTIAALAKLYSEQVESISAGPLEAVRATGATRLQNVVYAVVPQIIPPYISFTMYRWDINVRMSTIIGFVGGGGIGFLLQQNINLLNYRAAAAQILAIAIVVAAMDALSSRIRERYV
jgi:phosphonate ABC transporter permease subunit PhnE